MCTQWHQFIVKYKQEYDTGNEHAIYSLGEIISHFKKRFFPLFKIPTTHAIIDFDSCSYYFFLGY